MASVFSNKRLANPIVLTTVPQIFYTVPIGITTVVSAITIAASTGSVVNVSLHLCVGADAPSINNVLLPAVPIGGTVLVANFNFGQVLHSMDNIWAYASMPGVVTLHGTGIEIS